MKRYKYMGVWLAFVAFVAFAAQADIVTNGFRVADFNDQDASSNKDLSFDFGGGQTVTINVELSCDAPGSHIGVRPGYASQLRNDSTKAGDRTHFWDGRTAAENAKFTVTLVSSSGVDANNIDVSFLGFGMQGTGNGSAITGTQLTWDSSATTTAIGITNGRRPADHGWKTLDSTFADLSSTVSYEGVLTFTTTADKSYSMVEGYSPSTANHVFDFAVQIPEPASLGLIALIGMGLVAAHRFRT